MIIQEIWEGINKRIVLAIALGTLLIILLVAGLQIFAAVKKNQSLSKTESLRNSKYLLEDAGMRNRLELIYPETIEMQDFSMDLYRPKDFKWDANEVDRLWIDANPEDMDFFSQANHKLIWDILKNAP